VTLCLGSFFLGLIVTATVVVAFFAGMAAVMRQQAEQKKLEQQLGKTGVRVS